MRIWENGNRASRNSEEMGIGQTGIGKNLNSGKYEFGKIGNRAKENLEE